MSSILFNAVSCFPENEMFVFKARGSKTNELDKNHIRSQIMRDPIFTISFVQWEYNHGYIYELS